MCAAYYHGTSVSVLQSIARHGLLTGQKVKENGGTVVWETWSKPDHVYVSDSLILARDWGRHHSGVKKVWADKAYDYRYKGRVVLKVDLSGYENIIKPDSNFYSESYKCNYFEVPECIPPERISVMCGSKTKVPIDKFVDRYQRVVNMLRRSNTSSTKSSC